jgi:phage terminase large subunit-like protein
MIQLTEAERKRLEQKAAQKKELERRQKKERLRYYNAGPLIHKKQIEFHQNPSKERWLYGGNRSGKTEAGAVEAIYYLRGNHPYKKIKRPQSGWAVSLTNEVQRDVAQKKILSYLQAEWIYDIKMRDGKKPDFNNLENVTGTIDTILIKFARDGKETGELSELGFKSCDQGREKFQGTAKDFIWFDEEPPEDIYDECKMRLIDFDGDVWGTMTPLKGLTWNYKKVYMESQIHKDKSRIWCMFIEWNDNPFLSASAIQELMATMSDEERESRQYGRFRSLTGVVYPKFDISTHVLDPFPIDPKYHYYIMMDNGWKTTAVVFSAVMDGDLVIFDEIYAHMKSVEDVCAMIIEKARAHNWQFESNGYLRIWADSAVNQTNQQTGRNIASLLYDNGIYAATQVNKDVWAGIQRVKEYLKRRPVPESLKERWPRGKPSLFVFKNCTHTAQEFMDYAWAENKEGAPKKENDHCLTGDTIVNTVDGDFYIRDLVGKTGTVYCYDTDTGEKVTSCFENVRMTRENAPLFKMTLEDGREIKATDDHLILTANGWKPLKDITPDDFIVDAL